MFDYMDLDNSTMECIGTIGTVNDTAIITLVEIATFEVRAYESILPPNDPMINGRWAHSVSPLRSWDVYRVQMAGGAAPICAEQAETLEIGYAAEYWFYHSAGEDLKTDVEADDGGEDFEDPSSASEKFLLMI